MGGNMSTLSYHFPEFANGTVFVRQRVEIGADAVRCPERVRLRRFFHHFGAGSGPLHHPLIEQVHGTVVIVPSGRGTVSVRSCRDWASLHDGRMTIETELTGVTVKGTVLPGIAPDGWPSVPRLAHAHLPRTPAGANSAATPGPVRPIPAPLRLRRPALSRGVAGVPALRDHPAHRYDFEALTSDGYHDLGQPCERHRYPRQILRHIMFRPNLVRGRVAAHVRGKSAPWFKRPHEAATIDDDETDGLRDGRCFSDLFLGLHFRIAFLEKKGTAFQDWFVTLLTTRWGQISNRSDRMVAREIGNVTVGS